MSRATHAIGWLLAVTTWVAPAAFAADEEGLSLTGRILGPDGAPAADADVLVRGPSGTSAWGSAATDKDGRFTFETRRRSAPNGVVVYATGPDFQVSRPQLVAPRASDITLKLDAPGRVTLRVRGFRRGQPATAVVQVHRLLKGIGPVRTSRFDEEIVESRTRLGGPMHAGMAHITVVQGELSGYRAVRVRPGDDVNVDVTLLERGTVSAQLVDAMTNEPWLEPLTARLIPGQVAPGRVDRPERLRGGRLHAGDLPAGRHRLIVYAGDRVMMARDVEVWPRREHDLGELPIIVPTARGTIGVELVDAAGAVRVKRLLHASPAARAGVQVGDLIIAAGDVPVTELKVAARELDGDPGSRVVVTVLRDDEERRITVERKP